MSEIVLNDAVIKKVKEEAADMVKTAIGKDLVKIVLYGSCARGDYTQDSDIDIALIIASCMEISAIISLYFWASSLSQAMIRAISISESCV